MCPVLVQSTYWYRDIHCLPDKPEIQPMIYYIIWISILYCILFLTIQLYLLFNKKTFPTKIWTSDRIPTSLLNSCADVLLTTITNIIHLSHIVKYNSAVEEAFFIEGRLDQFQIKILYLCSKKKNSAKRIRSHLEWSDIFNQYQAHMQTTETALLMVENDLLRILDDG